MRILRTLAALSLAAVASVTPAHAVINGQSASNGEYPFMAALTDGTGFQFCGGSVISSRWILTAAHCLVDQDVNDLYIVTGRTDLSDTSTGQVIKADQIKVDPSYDGNAYDAGLVHLSVATSSPAITLSSSSNDNLEAAGTTVRVTGWGDTLPTLGLFATNQLQYVDLQVVSDSQCGETNFGFDAATGVCAAALLKDSCNGDSGGPLFWMNGATRIQIGIVSYGTSCALPEFPGVYSEVNNSQIRSFISTNAGV
jgi:secreted trypsin-like serine protease